MAKRWLTSKDFMDRWQAEPFEILEAHKNGLPFYNQKGEKYFYLSQIDMLKNLSPFLKKKFKEELKLKEGEKLEEILEKIKKKKGFEEKWEKNKETLYEYCSTVCLSIMSLFMIRLMRLWAETLKRRSLS